jgi:transcription termination/antitermination protein NusG
LPVIAKLYESESYAEAANVCTLNWYAVQTRSNFERVLASGLSEKGVETFCPATREVHRWKDRMKPVHVPLFPGYVFVRIEDTPGNRLRVVSTNGAVRILGDGSLIEPVPEHEIRSVRLLLESARPFSVHPFLKEGSWVRIKHGSMRGIEGRIVRFKNSARLVMSVEMLAKSIAVEIDDCDIEQVPEHARRG